MFTAEIYGREIKAKTLKGLKCKASKIANNYWKPFDEMFVTGDDFLQTLRFIRINKKCPNNTIVYGQWK